MKRKKIVVVSGAALSGNRGASAMLKTVLENLDSSLETYITTYYPEEDAELNRDPERGILRVSPLYLLFFAFPLSILTGFLHRLSLRVPDFLLPKTIRIIRKCDLFIDISGESFVDSKKLNVVYESMLLFMPLVFRRKVVKLSQSMGPFNFGPNRALACMLLPKVSRIFSREKETSAHLKRIGINNFEEAADLTFLMKHSGSAKELKKRFPFLSERGKKIIGISPSSFVEEKCPAKGIRYQDVLATFIRDLIADGYRVVILPHCFRNVGRRRNNDVPVCREIFSKVGMKGCYVIEENLSEKELRALISLFDAYATSRLHGMISALMSGTPVIVIGWSHKYLAVLDEYGLGECYIEYSSLDEKKIMETFRKVLKDAGIMKKRMRENRGRLIKSSMKNISYIHKVLS